MKIMLNCLGPNPEKPQRILGYFEKGEKKKGNMKNGMWVIYLKETSRQILKKPYKTIYYKIDVI